MTHTGTGHQDRWVLAIDLGTTRLKVGIVSFTGSVAWTTGAELNTRFTPDGGAEQDADEWWRLVRDAARAAVLSGTVRPDQIAAVSATGQWASTVPVAEDGTAVGPCILWMDTRGGRHARRRFGGPVSGYSPRALATWIRKSGGAPSTSGADPIGHMLHLELDRPAVARDARWYLEPVDYLSMRLTGTAAASPASMTAAWLTDNRHLGKIAYDANLIRMAGITRSKLPPLRPTGSVVGTVRDDIAADLGLGPGVAVVASTPDLHSAAAGAGTLESFQCHMAISTTSWISCPVPFKKTDPIRQIASVPGILPDQYLVANNHETAGACLQWLRDQVIAPDDVLSCPTRPGFAELTVLAATASPGSGGVLFTPWLAGERSPVDDRNARAGFHNLSLDTSRAALVRAVLEGVAYNNRWLHQAVEHFVKRRLEPIRLIGGGAQSDLWCQIHADVMDRTIERLADPIHANLRGAAILAGMTLGDIGRSAAGALAQIDAIFQPDASNRALYDRLYAEVPKLYKSQKAMFRRLNRGPASRVRDPAPSSASDLHA
jgi:xylulokinase